MESQPLEIDEGKKIIVKHDIDHYIPFMNTGQLPSPDDRLYYNANTVKPKRKLKKVKVDFGKITKQNQE